MYPYFHPARHLVVRESNRPPPWRHRMQRTTKAALLHVGVFLIWIGLLAMTSPRGAALQVPCIWQSLALVVATSLAGLLINLCLTSRRRFGWSLIASTVCGILLFYSYAEYAAMAFYHTPRPDMDRARRRAEAYRKKLKVEAATRSGRRGQVPVAPGRAPLAAGEVPPPLRATRAGLPGAAGAEDERSPQRMSWPNFQHRGSTPCVRRWSAR
jgi:hypothetical protein